MITTQPLHIEFIQLLSRNSLRGLCRGQRLMKYLLGDLSASLSVLQGMPWRFKNPGAVNVLSCYKVNSGQMAKAAALKGLGFAILPWEACRAELEEGALIKIELSEDEPDDLVLHALYSERKYPLAKVKAFLTYLRTIIEQHYS